ncbi:uncharacterized protein BP5553_08697 [Venustampulla echinocandica]|uniref:Uncharacterized protein n=1 Tax=Venustampulla echinocandica TaxID=2656787 RepID=A0A370TEZ2_9HELO|nr:uncharacterized protein BP5553_08697 [Venustampulla echinocandica]RDL33258.1 hypothetical protein BP5553_08697 [Venustampulla echinocandica]
MATAIGNLVSPAPNNSSSHEIPASITSLPNPALYTAKDHRIYSTPSPTFDPGPDDCIIHVRANGISKYAF